MYPPYPPYHPYPPMPYCPECERRRNTYEYDRYGFNIVVGGTYWSLIKEYKACCPVKVTLVEAIGNDVIVEIDGKRFTKTREDFFKSSWRDYEAY